MRVNSHESSQEHLKIYIEKLMNFFTLHDCAQKALSTANQDSMTTNSYQLLSSFNPAITVFFRSLLLDVTHAGSILSSTGNFKLRFAKLCPSFSYINFVRICGTVNESQASCFLSTDITVQMTKEVAK